MNKFYLKFSLILYISGFFSAFAHAQIPPNLPTALPTEQCVSNTYGWLEPFQFTILNDPVTGTLQTGERYPSADLYKGGWTYTPFGFPLGYPRRADSTPDSILVIDADTLPTELSLSLGTNVNGVRSGTGEEWLYVAKVEGRVGAQDTVTYSLNDAHAQEHRFVAAFDSSGNLLAKVPTTANDSIFSTPTTDLTFTFPADGVAYLYTWVADYLGSMDVRTFDNCLLDYGDALNSYQTLKGNNGPTHVIGHLFLGADRDDENNAVITAGNASDDAFDDGVTFPTTIETNQPIIISVDVVDIPTRKGYLQGWIDWDRNGHFYDAGEQIAVDVQDGNTGDNDGTANNTIDLSLIVPPTAHAGTSFARFRWSSTPGLSYNGPADDGEVEDYQITITANPQLTVTKIADQDTNIPVGQTVTYTYTVTNSGNQTLNDINLLDIHSGTGSAPVPDPDLATLTDNGSTGDSSNSTTGDNEWDVLAPGDVISLTAPYTITQQDLDTLQ